MLLENFQVLLGGSEVIQLTGKLSKILPGESHEELAYNYQVWGRYINIRRCL
jgi:hypothetical protein